MRAEIEGFMPYRFTPLLFFAILTTYVGQDSIRAMFEDSPEKGRVVGIPEVIDGDTIRIEDLRIRLHGIDAPEMRQPALNADGQRFDAGLLAKQGLVRIIGPRRVECHWRRLDRFDRPLGICSMTDGTEINAAMIDAGLAFAYWSGDWPWRRPTSPEYAARSLAAMVRGEGFHGFTIASPQAYRAVLRQREDGGERASSE